MTDLYHLFSYIMKTSLYLLYLIYKLECQENLSLIEKYICIFDLYNTSNQASMTTSCSPSISNFYQFYTINREYLQIHDDHMVLTANY